jgi:ubiquinone/menaquinone biosynthesis C-methylase UbiE
MNIKNNEIVDIGNNTVTLRCPGCKSPVNLIPSGIKCDSCGYSGQYHSNVLDLRLSADVDSALDLDSYDAHHNINESSARSTIQFYNKILAKYIRTKTRRVLEIGSGTGQLTWGLCSASTFEEVHCSDISLRFMTRLHAKLKERVGGKLNSYLFDANDFPFADNMFSVVVGHSVLHHLAHFEKAVENSFRVLEPGGVAAFGEPMMETHALLSLASQQLLALDEMAVKPTFSNRTKMALAVIGQRAGRATGFVLERPLEVHAVEDKFMFSANYLRDLAYKIGFSEFHMEQYAPVRNLGKLIEDQLVRELNANGANSEDIAVYRKLLQSFSTAYEPAMQPYVSQLFAFPIFVK